MHSKIFKIFVNDLFLCIKKSDLVNLADDHIITATCHTLQWLLKTLELESKSAVSWFKQNKMIVNADKFQAIVLNKKESETKYKLTTDDYDTESIKSVKLPSRGIDDRQRLEQHISICAPKLQCNLML